MTKTQGLMDGSHEERLVLAWFQESAPDHRIYMLIGRNTFSRPAPGVRRHSRKVSRMTSNQAPVARPRPRPDSP